jgi:hypothetical protein
MKNNKMGWENELESKFYRDPQTSDEMGHETGAGNPYTRK